MKLYFMLARHAHPVPGPVLTEVFRILSRRGFQIKTGIADEMVIRPDRLRVEQDLFILMSNTALSLSLAGILHHQGARLLNPYLSCHAAQNKIIATRHLSAAGIATPSSWVTADLRLILPRLEEGPLLIKPYCGHGEANVQVVHTPDELAAVTLKAGPVLIQRYIQGNGENLTVFVVGHEVFAIRKQYSPSAFAPSGQLCEVSREVHEIALQCGQIFGLGLYSLDLVESVDGPLVVDLNCCPGYTVVPNIAPLIANFIDDYARQILSLPQPWLTEKTDFHLRSKLNGFHW